MVTFEKFLSQSTLNKSVAGSKTAKEIYELIWSDSVRIKFVDTTEARLPALSVCATEIEKMCTSESSDLILTDPVKQTIGRMVSSSLRPFGYLSRKGRKARMPLHLKLNTFKYAYVFYYEGNETQRIERRIVDI